MSATVANVSSSSTMTTPKTPIRAITSTISNRSTPTVPPASQAYEPLLKSLFQHRFKVVLLLTTLTTWFVNCWWGWWQVGGGKALGFYGALLFPFSPWIVVLGLLSWTTSALPITILRKVLLHSQRSNAASPKQIIRSALSQTRTRIAFLTYLVSAVFALAIHVAISYHYEGLRGVDPKLTLFVKSKKHPHYLNGRLVFLLFSQISVALAFALRGAMVDRFVYKWADTGSKTTSTFLLTAVAATISAVYATLSIGTAATLFSITRGSLPIIYKIPFASLFLRPFTAHFLKGQWTIFLPITYILLLIRAWALAFTTFLTWEIADSMFEKVVEEKTPVSTFSSDPSTTLISGLTSNDKIFKYFAYSELRDLAQEQTQSAISRRAAIFGDQKSALNLWALLSKESLQLLGDDYQLFLRRGRPAPPPPAPAPATPKVLTSPHIVTPTPLLRQRVFKTHDESPGQAALDALASDGPIAKVVDVGAEATHMPELFKTVEQRVMTSPIASEAKRNVQSAAGVGSRVRARVVDSARLVWTKYAPEKLTENLKRASDWWAKDRLSKEVEASLPYRELDVVVVDALSHLVSASLTEDRYGTVQRDIPKILEIMITYLFAIEEYQMQIKALEKPTPTGPLTPEEQEEREILAFEMDKSQAVLAVVGDGLKEGVGRIVRTFGDKLLAFKFTPRVGQKLQEFIDYS